MAWNGSNSSAGAPANKRSSNAVGKKSRRTGVFNKVWLSALAAIALCGITAFWLLRNDSGKSDSEKRTSRKVHAKTTLPTKQPQSKKEYKPLQSERTWHPKATLDKTANIKPPARNEESRLRFKQACEKFFGRQIFTQPSDNIIAGVLSARPGTRFLPITIGEQFEKDFAESLNHPIEYDEQDTEEERQLKEAVAAAREMLKGYMDKGYSVAEVIREARAETDEITNYREKLNDNLLLLLDGGSEEDVVQYLEESNAILAEYDAIPLHISKFGWKKLRKRLEAEAAGEPRTIPSL